MDKSLRQLSDRIKIKAFKEANCFPVDRYFLEPYIEEILSFDRLEFIVYNLENVNNNYTVQLFLCLPELWDNLTIDEIKEILNHLTNEFSFYALILFTYKYLEIDIIHLILQFNGVSINFKNEIKSYLNNQYPNLLKSEGEILYLDEDLIGVTLKQYSYIKQKLLSRGFEPALKDLNNLSVYIKKIIAST